MTSLKDHLDIAADAASACRRRGIMITIELTPGGFRINGRDEARSLSLFITMAEAEGSALTLTDGLKRCEAILREIPS